MKWNTDKCYLILSKESDAEIRVGKSLIKNTYCEKFLGVNPLTANPAKWPNTLKQFGNLPTNCLSVFGHFAGLAVKGLKIDQHINFNDHVKHSHKK